MRCPKCGFISFDDLVACAKCHLQLEGKNGLPFRGTAIRAPYAISLGVTDSGPTEPELVPAEEPDPTGDLYRELEANGVEAGLLGGAEEKGDLDFSPDEAEGGEGTAGAENAGGEIPLLEEEIPAIDLSGLGAEPAPLAAAAPEPAAAGEEAEELELDLGGGSEVEELDLSPPGQEELLDLDLDRGGEDGPQDLDLSAPEGEAEELELNLGGGGEAEEVDLSPSGQDGLLDLDLDPGGEDKAQDLDLSPPGQDGAQDIELDFQGKGESQPLDLSAPGEDEGADLKQDVAGGEPQDLAVAAAQEGEEMVLTLDLDGEEGGEALDLASAGDPEEAAPGAQGTASNLDGIDLTGLMGDEDGDPPAPSDSIYDLSDLLTEEGDGEDVLPLGAEDEGNAGGTADGEVLDLTFDEPGLDLSRDNHEDGSGEELELHLELDDTDEGAPEAAPPPVLPPSGLRS
nr:hypothetical protein [Desulfobacteraceae bacterium]